MLRRARLKLSCLLSDVPVLVDLLRVGRIEGCRRSVNGKLGATYSAANIREAGFNENHLPEGTTKLRDVKLTISNCFRAPQKP